MTDDTSSNLEDDKKPHGRDECTSIEFPKDELPERQPGKFPKLKIVNSEEYDASDSLQILSSDSPSLNAMRLYPALQDHKNLHRVWLAHSIPDGFWPHLLTRIISDASLKSILSAILFIPFMMQKCTFSYASYDAHTPSLWKLYQKRFVVEFKNTKLLELKEISNKFKSCTNKFNLSEQYASQIELTIYTKQVVTLHEEFHEKLKQNNSLKLAIRILILLEQHILEVGEEWFSDTFHDSCKNEILSYVPCPFGLSQDNGCNLCSNNNTDHKFLSIGSVDIFCFSLEDLVIACTQSRGITCPTHNEFLVQQIAPDIVSTYHVISYSKLYCDLDLAEK